MSTTERELSDAEKRVREAVEYMVRAKDERGLGLSKERIAADAECTTTAVVFWLSGERSPRPAYCEKLADIIEREGGAKWAVKVLRQRQAAEAHAS